MPFRAFDTNKAKACKKCGALLGDPKSHKKWHKKNKPIPGPPGPPGPMGMAGPSSDPVTKKYVEDNI